jgi:Ca2+-transporting ATPase
VKGAPDVLISMASTIRDHQGIHQPVSDEVRQMLIGRNEEMAQKGLRVLVVAEKDLAPATFDPSSDLLGQVRDLNLLAMVGIVDPPRPEARDAIALCTGAGIRVRMITGDHVVTASAIADELGIHGEAITGKQLAGMTDEELANSLDGIGVVARVAPEHKVRMVKALQGRDDIVAMTGDGVNDAPALKMADIGVAMGITGSDVSKEASDMILTDDNFSTIVTAVEQGRIIYDNLLKFLRFQMANLLAFILSFVISAMFNIAGTSLFIPIQIIFLNFFISVPLGLALGSDTPTPGLMKNKPRPANENIIDRLLWTRLLLAGLVWALLTLAMYEWVYNTTGDRQLAQSASLATFCVLHIAFALNLRYPSQTIFQRQSLTNRNLLYAILFVFFITIALVESDILQRVFGTVSITSEQWAWVLAIFVMVILVTEVAKFVYKLATSREASGS